jgi:bis(5'-nucleosidyl)-tetraphosphatase
MDPIREHSAGVIPFLGKTGPRRRSYLLIHSARVLNPRARWEFPKGGIEPGESPRQAASREMMEETGLSSWRILDGFQESITYQYFRNGLRRIKTVDFFVAEVFDPTTIVPTFEHTEDPLGRWYCWSPYDEVQRLLCRARMRDLFRAADSWLQSSRQSEAAPSPSGTRRRGPEERILSPSSGANGFRGGQRR